MADMDDDRKYQLRMVITFVGVFAGMLLFLAALLFVMAFFFNPFGFS
jgi:hypothetical protein